MVIGHISVPRKIILKKNGVKFVGIIQLSKPCGQKWRYNACFGVSFYKFDAIERRFQVLLVYVLESLYKYPTKFQHVDCRNIQNQPH